MSNDWDVYDITPMIVIRQHFLDATDGNVCAASMLDRFHAEIVTGLEFATYHEKYERKKFNYTLEYSIRMLVRYQCGIFSENDVEQGIALLIEKEYIRIDGNDGNMLKIKVNYNKIYRELHPNLFQEENTQETPPSPPANEEEDLDERTPENQEQARPWKRNESRRVEYHNNRASRVGLPATLTVEQWTKTLEHFNQCCAFCSGPYDVLEHYVPLIHGGGTTEYNCIPACAQCNRTKHDKHPSMMSSSSAIFASLQVVQEYLEKRRTGDQS